MYYKIWDKKESILTPTGETFTANEWAEKYPWIKNPDSKMIICDSAYNGACVYEYEGAKKNYQMMGADIKDNMSVEEVLAAMEEFDNRDYKTIYQKYLCEKAVSDNLKRKFEILRSRCYKDANEYFNKCMWGKLKIVTVEDGIGKSRKCGYCSGQKRMEDTDLFNDFLIDGNLLSVHDEFDREVAAVGIKYCPWCGRKIDNKR